MDQPFNVFEESPSMRRAPVSRRVDDMFEQIKSKLPGAPKFLLCLLPERKNCEVYGWFIFLLPLLAFYIIIVPLQELYLFVSTRSLEEKVPC
jgi:hypothetical protein